MEGLASAAFASESRTRTHSERRTLAWMALVASCLGAACEAAPAHTALVPEPVRESCPRGRATSNARVGQIAIGRDVAIDTHTAAALEALGYVASTPTDHPETRGVTVLAPGTAPGLNLYSTRHTSHAVLMDNHGREVHRWRSDHPARPWMHVEPLPGGDLLAITKDHDLARFTWDSTVRWRVEMRAHHDVAVDEEGRVYALIREAETTRDEDEPTIVLADAIVTLDADGEELQRVPLLPLFEHLVSSRRFRRIRAAHRVHTPREVLRAGGIGDVLHCNSLTLLHRAIDGVAPAGSVLLSFRALSRIAILDPAMERVLFVWGEGELQGQHDATQLPNGHLLMFDNGSRRHASRVLELDARQRRIVWRYEGEDLDPPLYSAIRGGVQHLPNGHVLITESNRGRALEVTREGDVVWEFHNPEIRDGSHGSERGVIYRLNRYEPARFEHHGEPQDASAGT